MKRGRLHLRIDPKLIAKLENAAAVPHVTKSALVEAALRQYFEPGGEDSREANLLRRLDGFDLRQGAIERDTALIAEALGQFILYWLTRTEPLPEGARDQAHQLGQRRFDYFISQVAQKLGAEDGLSARVFPQDVADMEDDDA